MIRFYLKGASVTAEFSFFAMTAVVFLYYDTDFISAYLAAAFIHECAHGVALRAVGGSVSGIVLTACGIRIIPERRHLLATEKELFVLLSGPAVNLILFLFFSNTVCSSFAAVNLATAFFNLLPYSFLDGGCALLAASRIFSCERHMLCFLNITHILFFVFSVICISAFGYSYLPLAIFALLYGIYDFK